MLKELIENKCVDISRLLLLRAKELNIDDNECHILLIVYTLKDIGIKTVTPQMIQNYSVLSNQELEQRYLLQQDLMKEVLMQLLQRML